MSFEKKSFSDVYESLVADTQQRIPELDDFQEGSVVRSLYESFACELAMLYEQLDLVYQAGFVDTAEAANLDRVVVVLGLKRNEPDFASGEVTFERDPGQAGELIIPIGTLVSTEEDENQKPPRKAYVTVEEGRMADGQTVLDVRVQALERGREWTAEAETLVVMPRPVPGIKSVINNKAILFLGRDRETDEELRTRAKQALLASGRASLTAIETALLSMTGVLGVRVQEDQHEPGVIQVYVDGLTPTNAPNLRARIDEVRAAGIYVRLSEAEPVKLDVALKIEVDPRIKRDERHDVEQRVQAAVEEFIQRVPMGQPLLFSQLTSQVLGIKGVTDLSNFQITVQSDPPKSYGLADKKIDADINERFKPSVQVADDPKELPIDVQVRVIFPDEQNQSRIFGIIQDYIKGLTAGIADNVAAALKPFYAQISIKADALKNDLAVGIDESIRDKMVDELKHYFDDITPAGETGARVEATAILGRLQELLSGATLQGPLADRLKQVLKDKLDKFISASLADFPETPLETVLKEGVDAAYKANLEAAQKALDGGLQKAKTDFDTAIQPLDFNKADDRKKLQQAQDDLEKAQKAATDTFNQQADKWAGQRESDLGKVPAQIKTLRDQCEASLKGLVAPEKLTQMANDNGKLPACGLEVSLKAVLYDGEVCTDPQIQAGIIEKPVPGVLRVLLT